MAVRPAGARSFTPSGVWPAQKERSRVNGTLRLPRAPFPMSRTFFEKPVERKTGVNPLGLRGFDHIEFYVDNADQWRDFFVQKYGMSPRAYGDNATGLSGRRSHVVGQGRVNFVVS